MDDYRNADCKDRTFVYEQQAGPFRAVLEQMSGTFMMKSVIAITLRSIEC
jgi:hypothetical protein